MPRRFPFSQRALFLATFLICLGIGAVESIFLINDYFQDVTVQAVLAFLFSLSVAGASFGGAFGVLVNHPKGWAMVGAIALPVIGLVMVPLLIVFFWRGPF